MTIQTITKHNACIGFAPVECASAITLLEYPLDGSTVRYVDSKDDGRGIQTAITYDGKEEDCNPTEGGGLASISFSAPSLSDLVQQDVREDYFETTTRMAYWIAVEGWVLSNDWLHKKVTLLPNKAVVEVDIHPETGTLRKEAKHEILTGYMPVAFSRFFTLARQLGSLTRLSATPSGEQALPVVFATPDGASAMGILIPAWGDSAPAGSGYGRWAYGVADNVVKWNAVTRVANPGMTSAFRYKAEVAFGTVADVVAQLSSPLGLLFAQIRRLYRATLGREPDLGGQTYHVGLLQTGTSLVTIAGAFIASGEFQTTYGNKTDVEFVRLLYVNVLGRIASDAEINFHVTTLRNLSRAQVVVNFSESPEHQIRVLMV